MSKFLAAVAAPTVALAAVATMGVAAGAASAAPAPSTDISCGSANPLPWAPPFTWRIHADSGESVPPGGSTLQPSLLLSGGNELPRPQGFSFGPNWYGTQVLVDWRNETTGASGRSVSDQEAWAQAPGIPVNRTFTGVGTVSFTVTVQTGAGWWFVNTQNAICKGEISVVPGRG